MSALTITQAIRSVSNKKNCFVIYWHSGSSQYPSNIIMVMKILINVVSMELLEPHGWLELLFSINIEKFQLLFFNHMPKCKHIVKDKLHNLRKIICMLYIIGLVFPWPSRPSFS